MSKSSRREQKKMANQSVVMVGGISVQQALGKALTYQNSGQTQKAEVLYKRILEADPGNSDAYHLLGNLMVASGNAKLAINLIEKAISINPEESLYYSNLANVLKGCGSIDEAIIMFSQALSINPGLEYALLGLGQTLFEQDKYEEAIPFLNRYLELHPDYVQGYNYLGEIYESLHDQDNAELNANRALELDPTNPLATRILSTLLRRKGQVKKALDKLSQINIPDAIDEDTNIVARSIYFELGKLYDSCQDSEHAYTNFVEGNQLLSDLDKKKGVDKNTYLSLVKRIEQCLSADWVKAWNPMPDTLAATSRPPIFIVGFPRSGTTLLDQVLDSHPLLHVIEEKPIIHTLIDMISGFEQGYPGTLAGLTEQDVRELQRLYYHLLTEYIELSDEVTLVDKNPLNLVHAAMIERIFPGAKFILMLRHPCDTCFSCFMQPFRENNAMANFYTIEDSIHLYDQVMRVWRKSTELLPINYYAIKYESLVDNFDAEIRKLFNFLEIEWDDSVKDYMSHARQRGRIRTPSYNQVTRPIYKEAKYRWKRYEKYLAPYMSKLTPYIKYFDY